MNTQLVQLYLQGLREEYFAPDGSYLTYSIPRKFLDPLYKLEENYEADEEWSRKDSEEWERAKALHRREKLDAVKSRG